MRLCDFCGIEANSSPKVILIENTEGVAICNYCISTARLLIDDPEYEYEQVIDIFSKPSDSIA